MDKDNLDIQGILNDLTSETFKSAQAETFQQLLSALCLTAVGLFLAILGLLGLTLKLGRLVKFTLVFAGRPIALLFAAKSADTKELMGSHK